MNSQARIFVAGHRGLVGSAIVRRLRALGYEQLLFAERRELDLTRQAEVETWFAAQRPEVVIMAAAKVGGIHANNTYAADFIRDNLAVQINVIDAAYRHGTRKLTFLGSSCIYPKHAPQPMNEDCLLTGPLEPTNEWYAVAKIAGIKMCQAYLRQFGFDAISLMPTNLYGPGDNFSLENSHVLPALMRKIHEAKRAGSKSVVVWGTGTPRREFLYVDDLADAVVFLTRSYSGAGPINVGVGTDITIRELAELMGAVIGFRGELVFDTTKPDGTSRKLLDVGRLRSLGWQATTALEAGLRITYDWFCANEAQLRR
ncbi:MAG TPA: GDP-L-fucose synthase [Steroidobacteraceae bacterium]|nr:GDP-L-fucose synthase [Steroidobacteraceae bacterium]